MKPLILCLGLLLVTLFTAGCASGMLTAVPKPTVPDYVSLQTKAATAEFKVVYDLRLKDLGKDAGSGQKIEYAKPPKRRTDTITSAGADSVYELEDGAYVCDNRSGSLGCARVDVPPAVLNRLRDRATGASGDFKETRQVLEITAYCYLSPNRGNSRPLPDDNAESCYSADGVLLASSIKTGRFETTLLATSYSTVVSDDDFRLPATVLNLPATDAPAGPNPNPLSALFASHIAANVPNDADFPLFLDRDLTKYFQGRYGKVVRVGWEMLREGPTQTGIAYPKYYLWVRVSNEDTLLSEGAVRAAAIAKERFEVTDFLDREHIRQDRGVISAIFPATVADRILGKVGPGE